MNRAFVTLLSTPFQWSLVVEGQPMQLLFTFAYAVISPDGSPAYPVPMPGSGWIQAEDVVQFSYSETVATLHAKISARIIEIAGPTAIVFLDDKGFL